MSQSPLFSLPSRFFWLLTGFIWLLSGCSGRQEAKQEIEMCDLPQLKAKGTLTAATLYSSTSYFQYKMRPMGYEYEMIQDFARSQGLELQIKVAENTTRLVELLETGEADVAAYPIQITNAMKERLRFCGRKCNLP